MMGSYRYRLNGDMVQRQKAAAGTRIRGGRRSPMANLALALTKQSTGIWGIDVEMMTESFSSRTDRTLWPLKTSQRAGGSMGRRQGCD